MCACACACVQLCIWWGWWGATVLGRNCSIILSSLSPFMGHCSSTTTALLFPFQCSALHLKLFCCSSIYISLQCLAFVFCSTPPHFTEMTRIALSAQCNGALYTYVTEKYKLPRRMFVLFKTSSRHSTCCILCLPCFRQV